MEHVEYWLDVCKATIRYWLAGNAPNYAGSLAFFTLFSIATVIILAVQVISLVMSTDAAMAQIMTQLEGTIGKEGAEAVQTAVVNSQLQEGGIFPTLLGISIMIIGATTVFAQMQRSLNTIWEVVPRPSRNTLWLLIKSRLLSLTVVLSLGFVLLVSLLLSVAVSSILAFAQHWLPISGLMVRSAEVVISITVTTLLFGTLFRVLPDVILHWKQVITGAFMTALLFAAGRYLISLYLAHTATASTYGAAGSLVVLLMWVYYSSLILVLGAAFTRARAEAQGDTIRPRPTAVRVHRQLVAL